MKSSLVVMKVGLLDIRGSCGFPLSGACLVRLLGKRLEFLTRVGRA